MGAGLCFSSLNTYSVNVILLYLPNFPFCAIVSLLQSPCGMYIGPGTHFVASFWISIKHMFLDFDGANDRALDGNPIFGIINGSNPKAGGSLTFVS